jgi:2-keto-4-pentenoate hydratase/2-oxohepta-3-ene-1,7-dioic acid hydratase in catechol pathway
MTVNWTETTSSKQYETGKEGGVKIARYEIDGGSHYGLLEGEALRRISGSPFDSLEPTGRMDDLKAVRLLAPVERPRIFGVGLNYVLHIEESGAKTPAIPLLFMKPSTAVIGPDEPIIYPREGQNVHFEAELAVVIGRAGRRIAAERALEHVLGYTCANDISERVIQKGEMDQGALLVGKGFDTFCPLGPVIATDVEHSNLRIGAKVNGVERQSSSTSDLLFPVPQLIAYLSMAMTLLPGDVILTGTPSGVGPIVPGDVVDIFVEGVGTLSNTVVAEG